MSQHWYNPEGEFVQPGTGYPSATTILSVRHNQGLQDWRDRMGAQEADAYKTLRADIGTEVHAWIEKSLNDGQFVYGDSSPNLLHKMGYLNWHEKTNPKGILTEQFVFHDLHEYAGTADLICEIDGEPWLIDFKTSKRIDDGYALQLAAYAEAYKHMTGIECRRAVLQLTPEIKRGWRWKEFTDANDFGVFMAHKEIFDWQLKVAPKRKENLPTNHWTGGMIPAEA
jgi:hypothetical protein